MPMYTPAEVTANYAAAGAAKAAAPAARLLLLSVLAGLIIALGAAVTSTATHAVDNVSAARVISGLLFPFGLAMVILSGSELFTGNCLISISVLDRRATVLGMLRNWGLVFLGNFVGALLPAAALSYTGYLSAGLGAYAIKLAAAKCALPFGSAVVLGVLCNLLVCMGVICSLTAQDTTGRILGAYLPVSFFVICGFEHCVANMFYIPAGLFALAVPPYAELAAASGVDFTALTWGNFILANLLPVTVGNIVGGLAIGGVMWAGHSKQAERMGQ